ncbi:hypothetical protein [Alteriqipengyuania lutimaris]|uniref:Flagellar hook-length control protein FliK n=1 Tax=Alteriqipengyuania lutimaris TaxID=1538146 RepID=A0A395LJA2_9SPHN|nr:hypothetical protein [Alteriqipengyuania lutimaris]MBB3033997.1 flagellar hook-length control protein FliK [Alteriqipengyuania lutimaris]RDS77053.1 hypothetical protein DL238_05120 [Alteriqipengyuania lutimaris]
MTALSLNLTPARPLDASGIALEGLPTLEAGRSVPADFAEALKKLTASSREPMAEEAASEGTDGVPALPEGTDPASVEDAGAAASGKALPVGRSDLAAMHNDLPIEAGEPGTRAPDGSDVETGAEAVVASQPGKRAPADIEVEPEPEGAPDHPARTAAQDTQMPVVQASLAESAPALVVAAPMASGTAPRTGSTAQPEKPASTGTPMVASSVASASQAPVALAAGTQSDDQRRPGQDSPSGEQGRRSEGEAKPAASPATRDASGAPVAARGIEQVRQEATQTGLTFQLRAADRPVADPGQSLSLGSTLSTSASMIAAPTLGALPASASLGVAAPAGQMPHFPELAAMVDRIAAARDSAGSASATIALAHKELGNLSLTFETSGRTLDVEVAAQDSDTQRALAAAIAADRPQLRATEALAQPNGQANAQSGGSSGQAGTQGSGAGMADPSGTTGDSRQDRRERRGDNSPSGQDTHVNAQRQPKSDGGIYA